MKLSFILALSPLIYVTSLAQAAVIYSHSGATDPLTEGFSNIDAGVGVTTGPLTNDLGTGLDAWFVDDDSLAAGSAIVYRSSTLSGTAVTEALASGWTLSINVRLVDGTTGIFDGTGGSFITGTTAYSMTFDVEGDGDPTVNLLGGGSFTLEGEGNGGYHLFELVYDPVMGSADLFVDGVERISDYNGAAVSAPARINWGGNASNGTGRGHFNSVVFSTVPEPSVFLLLSLGLTGSVFNRRR